LTLTITAGSAIGDTSTLCQSIDQYLTNVSCSGTLTNAGDTVTLDFNGGLAIPPSTQNLISTFYIGEIGVDPTQITSNVGVPTHDPSTLVLLAVGMAMLAIGGVRRYA